LLLQDADFLILDEPTNHLDMEIIEFLEDYLKKSRSTLFMVTHDRYFLDRVCNTVYELDRGDLYVYKRKLSGISEKREERVANMVAVPIRPGIFSGGNWNGSAAHRVHVPERPGTV
jgi:ATP-binding cassette subfamily F protein uup